jgi:hypothetical protein
MTTGARHVARVEDSKTGNRQRALQKITRGNIIKMYLIKYMTVFNIRQSLDQISHSQLYNKNCTLDLFQLLLSMRSPQPCQSHDRCRRHYITTRRSTRRCDRLTVSTRSCIHHNHMNDLSQKEKPIFENWRASLSH